MNVRTLFSTSRRLLAVAAAFGVAATAVVTASANADSALPPLTIAASTSNVTAAGALPFVQGTMYAITYIITDTANAKLTGVSFSDQLPAGVTVAPDTTANALNCGNFTPTSDAGANTISESGLTVYGNSPNHCALEFFVIASTVEGPSSDTPGTVQWTDNGTSEPSSDVSFPSWSIPATTPPTIAITTPVNGSTYAFNQKVALALTGTAGAGDSIPTGDLYAVDENGTEVANGNLIPTDIPGTHTLTVWAETADGYIGSGQRVSYTVSSPQPVDVVAHPKGSLSYHIKYLATGRVTATLRYGTTVIGYARKWVHVGFEMPMWISPNTVAQSILAHHKHGLTATLTLEYQAWNYHAFTNTPANVVENVRVN